MSYLILQPFLPGLVSEAMLSLSESRFLRWLCLPLQVFKPRTPLEAISLCSRLLEYTPATRLSPLEACANSFFDELREPNARLPNGRDLPPLFNFSPVGKWLGSN